MTLTPLSADVPPTKRKLTDSFSLDLVTRMQIAARRPLDRHLSLAGHQIGQDRARVGQFIGVHIAQLPLQP